MGGKNWQKKIDKELVDNTGFRRDEIEEMESLVNDDLALIHIIGFRSLDARDDSFGCLV